MQHFGLNISNFAKKVDISQPNLSQILKGNRSCGEAVINKIVLSTRCSKHWLLTGEGEMILQNDNDVSMVGAAKKAIKENTVSVKFFDVSPSASFSELDYAVSQGGDTLDVVPLRGERITSDYCVFEIHGDSMSPTLLSHARILCKTIPESQWHYAEGVIVIAYQNKVVVKRIERNDLLSNSCLHITSDNPSYGSEIIQQSDIHCMFKAKRIISQDIF